MYYWVDSSCSTNQPVISFSSSRNRKQNRNLKKSPRTSVTHGNSTWKRFRERASCCVDVDSCRDGADKAAREAVKRSRQVKGHGQRGGKSKWTLATEVRRSQMMTGNLLSRRAINEKEQFTVTRLRIGHRNLNATHFSLQEVDKYKREGKKWWTEETGKREKNILEFGDWSGRKEVLTSLPSEEDNLKGAVRHLPHGCRLLPQPKEEGENSPRTTGP